MEPLPAGTMLDHFRIEHRLGAGGMGSVYCGTDITLNRQVAIKILDPRLQDNADNRERFQREARIIAGLHHPNLMHIYFVGNAQGYYYFVMEYIKGAPLQEVINRRGGKLALNDSLRMLAEVMSALRKVHSNGIVHRDLKPANIMIEEEEDRAILVDFGLSKDCDESAGLTTEGSILGTPDYMSPEQIEGGAIGPHTDIYALGIMLYQMISGISPFRRKTTILTLRAHCEESPPPLNTHSPNVPPALAQIIGRMICRDISRRYQNIEELASALLMVYKHPALAKLAGPTSGVRQIPEAGVTVVSSSARAPAPGTPSPAPNLQNRPAGVLIGGIPRTGSSGAPVAVGARGSANAQGASRPARPGIAHQPTRPTIRETPKRRNVLALGIGGVALAIIAALVAHIVFTARKSRDAAPKTAQSVQPTKPAQPAQSPTAPSAEKIVAAPAQPAAAAAPTEEVYIPAPKTSPSAGIENPGVVVHLHNGQRLNGHLAGLDGEKLKILLFPRGSAEYQLQDIAAIISLESDRLGYLKPAQDNNTENPDFKNRSRLLPGQPRHNLLRPFRPERKENQ